MKYYKLNGEVFAYEQDGSQDHLITADHKKMTKDQIDRHINPEKYLSDDEKSELNRKRLPALTKRQFNLYAFDNNLLESINEALTSNPRAKLEFDSSDKIERLSPTVNLVIEVLGLTQEQVDDIWRNASLL